MQRSMRAVARLRLFHHAISRCPHRPCSSSAVDRAKEAHEQQSSSSPSVTLLREIVANLASAGHKFVLPQSTDVLEQLASPLKDLMAKGAQEKFVRETFSTNPALLKLTAKQTTLWSALIAQLMAFCALNAEEALRIMSAYSDNLIQIGAEEIGQRADAILSNGLSSDDMSTLMLSCPEVLLTRDAKSILHLCENLRGFFSNAMMKKLLTSHPKVLLCNFEELQAKYEYIYFHMGIENAQLLTCREWVSLTLDEIQLRHQFLVRAGVYLMPDPKKPQLQELNPELRQILDCKERVLATSVAGVTFEEWNVFKSVWEKEQREKGDENTYARIKPSQRKTKQRTMKPEIEKSEDFEFRQ